MLIGDISKQTGFSKDTLRWYEKIGLIELDKKDRYENNFRNYDRKVLERLLFIKQVKLFGFTLKEIEEILSLDDTKELSCGSVNLIMEPKLKEIDKKIIELQNLRSKLLKARENCSGNCKDTFEGNNIASSL